MILKSGTKFFIMYKNLLTLTFLILTIPGRTRAATFKATKILRIINGYFLILTNKYINTSILASSEQNQNEYFLHGPCVAAPLQTVYIQNNINRFKCSTENIDF